MKIFALFLIVLLTSCIHHEEKEVAAFFSPEITLNIEYAEGLDIVYTDNYIVLKTHAIEGNEYFNDSLCLITNPNFSFSDKTKVLGDTSLTICCQSSTYLAYANALNKLDCITGLCGMNYLVNESVKTELQKHGTLEICATDQLSSEILLELNPSLVLTYPFGSAEGNDLGSNGLTSLFIAEYLEKDALARLEWIKLFGILFHQEKVANEIFERVKSDYTALIQSPSADERFIMNLPYEDNWYMPSKNSLIVDLLEDAGIGFFYADEKGTENKLKPKEVVWKDGESADYWIIIASRPTHFSLSGLIAEDPVYGTFKSVKENKVLFCNTGSTDYFGKGILEPDVMLKDILFATGKISNHTPVYFKLLK